MADDRPNRVATVSGSACRAHGARVSMSLGVEGGTASGADAGRPIGHRDRPAGSNWSVSRSPRRDRDRDVLARVTGESEGT